MRPKRCGGCSWRPTRGHALAQRDMGMLYEQGQGVTPDVLEAYLLVFPRESAGQQSRPGSAVMRCRRCSPRSNMKPIAARLKGWRPIK
jgi:hypothetical protein